MLFMQLREETDTASPQELVKQYFDLQVAHRALVQDFENEQESRRGYQERVKIAEGNSDALIRSVVGNSHKPRIPQWTTF